MTQTPAWFFGLGAFNIVMGVVNLWMFDTQGNIWNLVFSAVGFVVGIFCFIVWSLRDR